MANGKKVFTDEQRTRVAQAIADAERQTTGEIVPVVVASSDPYPGARWRIAVAFSLLIAFILYGLAASIDPIWYLLVQIPALLFGHLLAGIGSIQRLFLSEASVLEEVQQRAFEAFSEYGVCSTSDHTGILIFVSRLERRVVILADSGINAKVPIGTWDRIVNQLVERMREGDLANALTIAVQDCGKVLAEYFPGLKAPLNELPNRLVVED